MSDEKPRRERPVYKRREFDINRHCGAPVDRSMETRRARIERLIETEGRLVAKGTLTKSEKGLLDWTRMKLVSQGRALNLADARERAMGPDTRPCCNLKGHKTDHPGVGLCYKHCACKGKDGGHLSLYGRARDKRLAQLIEELEDSNEDVLNLEPHAKMIMAKIMLFLDDKQDFEAETIKSLTLLAEQFRRTVDSIADKKFKSMISLDLFNVLQFRMGEAVAEVVKDPEMLERIMERWGRISVDAAEKKLQRMITVGS